LLGQPNVTSGRVGWVDYAKGLCIVMVVMMHSTLGVEKYAGGEGWLGLAVEFARPFRMPDFFLISGLFLARVIDRDWRTYLDRKVIHFAYFYVLWVTIQCAFRCWVDADSLSDLPVLWFNSMIEAPGAMWFIYMLPVFFVVTKLTRGIPWWIVWSAGALLQIAPIHTGFTGIDEFASRFVYFYTGYALAPMIFKYAALAQRQVVGGLAFLGVWAAINGTLVFSGYGDLPVISLALGLYGAAAIVCVGALLSRIRLAAPLRYCGEHSIVIYLGFFLPMVVTRMVLLKTGLVPDIGAMSAIVTAISVVSPIILYWIVRGIPLRFLFERPGWARLPVGRPVMQPAE